MIELKRDVMATTIPYGKKAPLPAGTRVEITQELGGSFTVMSDLGLLRIEGKDADALGLETPSGAPELASVAPADVKGVTTAVWDQLKTCYDPEIPVSIVELGLVYENKVEPVPEGGFRVEVKFTLTAQGCGMGSVLREEIHQKILGIPGVKAADVEVVMEPPWNPRMMSQAAKLQLGMG